MTAPYEKNREERQKLEDRLSKMLQNLLDRPDNVLLLRQLGTAGIHVSDVRIKISRKDMETGIERREREVQEMREWNNLFRATRKYEWNDFVRLCADKIDITGPWKTKIAAVVNTSVPGLRVYEKLNFVRLPMMQAVAALPDWQPSTSNQPVPPPFRWRQR